MKRILLMISLCAGTLPVYAAIYKTVDANGHITYSSAPIKGASSKRLHLEPLPTMKSDSSSKSSTGKSTSGNFPSVDTQTQKKRDNKRRTILESELEAEQDQLQKARAQLTAAKEKPEVFRVVTGKRPDGSPIVETRRNMAKYQNNVKSAEDKIDLHQQNIQAIQFELSRLK